jgi:hypothetical protein
VAESEEAQLDHALLDDLRAALRYAPPGWPQRAEVEQLLQSCEARLGGVGN